MYTLSSINERYVGTITLSTIPRAFVSSLFVCLYLIRWRSRSRSFVRFIEKNAHFLQTAAKAVVVSLI
jgi:hypothetical protein